MSTKSKPTISFGTGNLSTFTGTQPTSTAGSADALLEALHVLRAHNITHIDTAQRYGNGTAESTLGSALSRLPPSDTLKFTVSTKWLVEPTSPTLPSTILPTAQTSSDHLIHPHTTTTPISTFYLHQPPHETTPLLPLLTAIDTAHKSHLFTHFGLSNFPAPLVSEIHALCTAHALVPPTVYQGMYNAVHRAPETALLPLLRTLNIRFAAYAPVAGGFLTKTREAFEASVGAGRWAESLAGTPGGVFRDTYVNEVMLDVLGEWGEIMEQEGVGRAEGAVRWVVWHSALGEGDQVVLGARDVTQLEETVRWVEKGPLSERAAERVERVWVRLCEVGGAGGVGV